MSGETSVKFLIPESSCEKDFEVWALFANETKESVLHCNWKEKYHCDSAPGYTHTLENGAALITVSRDLEKKPEDFFCYSLFRPKTDPSRCICRTIGETLEEPWNYGVIGIAIVDIIVFVVLVAVFIYRCYRRQTSSTSEHDPNVRPDECKPLRLDIPQISATDSQKSSTPMLTAPSTRTVPPKQETILSSLLCL